MFVSTASCDFGSSNSSACSEAVASGCATGSSFSSAGVSACCVSGLGASSAGSVSAETSASLGVSAPVVVFLAFFFFWSWAT